MEMSRNETYSGGLISFKPKMGFHGPINILN